MPKRIIVTHADIEAWRLLKSHDMQTTNFSAREFTQAGDEIILLAEKIKAERLTIAMQFDD